MKKNDKTSGTKTSKGKKSATAERCSTPRCKGDVTITYLGKPLCTQCWEKASAQKNASDAAEVATIQKAQALDTNSTQPYRLEGSDRVEKLTDKQAKARNLSRKDGKKWVLDPSAADVAKDVALPPVGEERQAREAEGRKRDKAIASTAKASGAKKPAKKREGLSGLDAAAQVLKDKGEPMSTKAMVEVMLAAGTWKTNGATPSATIYSAILREIGTKGPASRFKKTDRGLFAYSGK